MQKNKRFLDLPLGSKNVAAHPEHPNPHRGYSYVGQEKLSKVKDFEKGVRDAAEVHDIKVTSNPMMDVPSGLAVVDISLGVLRPRPRRRYHVS
jgi:hypothetical protein